MKKKIFITSHNLRIDGVSRSLIGLLNSIDYSKFEVDLFLLLHEGEYMKLIHPEVHLLPENKKYGSILIPALNIFKSGYLDILYFKWKMKKKANKFWKKQKYKTQNTAYPLYLHKRLLSLLPQINNIKYDLAISFVPPHYHIRDKIEASVKIGWLHNDFSVFDFDIEEAAKMWDGCDYIASISKSCSESFIKIFPALEKKVIMIENILHKNIITKQAEEFLVDKEISVTNNVWVFCSVGRYSYLKNFDNIPSIAKNLRNLGIKFKWYLIGFGDDEELIHRKITENGMEGWVIDLGKKENPYPYIKACDIYIQPSRSEGKSVSVREAQILARPVVITSFPTAASQLSDGVDGIIVPMDNEGCAKGIAELLNIPELLDQLRTNCTGGNFSNENEIEKIYNLLRVDLFAHKKTLQL